MKGLSRRHVLQGSTALIGAGLLSSCGFVPLPGLQATKVRRIAFLSGAPAPRSPSAQITWSAFRQGLHDLGYVEGQNLVIEERSPSHDGQLAEPLAELMRLQPEVILVPSVVEARAVQAVTTTLPIVSAQGDLVATGLAASLARPGGNVTGLSTPLLASKQLQLLQETVPGLFRVAILLGAATPGVARANYEAAVRSLGLQLQLMGVDSAEDLDGFFGQAVSGRADGLLVFSGGVISKNQERIGELALQHRLPSMWQQPDAVGRGGLLAYGPNREDLYRRAATYVDKILKGEKPADLPAEQPTKFDFIIDLKTAGALGLAIPPSVLQQATEIDQ